MTDTHLTRRTMLRGTGAVTVGGLLAACGSSGTSPSGKGPIELVAYNNIPTVTATLGAAFTKRTGTTVKIISTGGVNYESVDQRVQTDLAAGHVDDIALIGASALGNYVQAGRAVALDGLMRESGFDTSQLYPKMLTLGVQDGKTYALPYAAGTLVLFYNADAFTKAGLDPDKPPTTFSEMRACARELVSSKATRYGATYGNDNSGNWAFQNFLLSNGGSMLTPDRTKPMFNEAPGVQVVEFWAKLFGDGLGRTMTKSESDAAFVRGDLGMLLDAVSVAVTLRKSATFEVRSALMPIPDGGARRCPLGGASLVVLTKDPARQKKAFRAVAELVGPASVTTLVKAKGYSPVNQVAATETQYLAKNPLLSPGTQQLKDAVPWVAFPGPHSAEITKNLDQETILALRGEKSPADALDAAAKEATSMMSSS
ncbi:ABC transporter substrate-binding protein [Streptomyces sp. NPDC001508]|uniref:ABC transporter substrate-binding protein n=1 Tax=Streptomyces sp. NPDC001508 TaxID=3154656 RepID=UPI003316BC60